MRSLEACFCASAVVISTVTGLAEAGMLKYRKLRNPERAIESEFRVYNAATLPSLIPSVEAPPTQRVYSELLERETVIDGSRQKYIFGWLRYRRPEDVWYPSTITFKLDSLNDPNLAVILQPLEVTGLTEQKSYFLIPIPASGSTRKDSEVIVTCHILKAEGVPPDIK